MENKIPENDIHVASATQDFVKNAHNFGEILKSIEKDIRRMGMIGKFIYWFMTVGQLITMIISAVIFFGVLLLFIWTGNIMWLKVDATIFIVGVAGVMIISSIEDYRSNRKKRPSVVDFKQAQVLKMQGYNSPCSSYWMLDGTGEPLLVINNKNINWNNDSGTHEHRKGIVWSAPTK
jgi:hypothetical protein